MAEIIWTETALYELDAIAEYFALDKPKAASDFVTAVFEKTDHLADFPNLGRMPPELSGSVYRELLVPPCRIFYRLDGARTLIIYVMREERQLRAYMLGDD